MHVFGFTLATMLVSSPSQAAPACICPFVSVAQELNGARVLVGLVQGGTRKHDTEDRRAYPK